MNASQARRLLTVCDRQGDLGRIVNRGAQWVRDRVLAAIHVLETSAVEDDRALLAYAWSMLSSLWYLLRAYNESLQAQFRCLELCPRDVDYLLWAAEDCADYGLTERAEELLQRALEISPGSPKTAESMQHIRNGSLLGHLDSWETLVADLLAQNRPDDALAFLRKSRSQTALQWRARAWSAAGEIEAALACWERLARMRGPVTLDYPDWFYLSDPLQDEPRLWSALLTLAPRLSNRSIVSIHCSLDESTRELRLDGLHLQKKMFEFQLARTTRDAQKMADLSREFPGWTNARRGSVGLSTPDPRR